MQVASCTGPIGPDDNPMAVYDSNFKVRSTDGLRVVDASVFPKIPGFDIALPLFIVSEKASHAIIKAAQHIRVKSPAFRKLLMTRHFY